MSALSGLKQRLSTVNHSALAPCTMIDANPIPDSIVGASVLTAFFLFRAMLDAQTGCLGKVRTLLI
jgi:hypothetical protein